MDFQLVSVLLACCLGIARGHGGYGPGGAFSAYGIRGIGLAPYNAGFSGANAYYAGLGGGVGSFVGGGRPSGIMLRADDLDDSYAYGVRLAGLNAAGGVGNIIGGGSRVGNTVIRGGGLAGAYGMAARPVGNIVYGGRPAGLTGLVSGLRGIAPALIGSNGYRAAPFGNLVGAAPFGNLVGAAPVGNLVGAAPMGNLIGAAPMGNLIGAAPFGNLVGAAPFGNLVGARAAYAPAATMPVAPIGSFGGASGGDIGGGGRVLSSNYFGPVTGISGDAYGGSSSATATDGGLAISMGGTAVTGSGVGDSVMTGIGTGVTSGSSRFSYGGDYYGAGFPGAAGGSQVSMQCGQVMGSYCPAGTFYGGNCGGKKKKCKICCHLICKTKGKKGPSYYRC